MGCSSSKPGATIPGASLFSANGDPKSRCVAMLRESTDLNTKLVKAGKELRSMAKHVETALDTGNAVLNSPLPHVYEDKDSVSHAMTEQHDPIGGKGFTADALSKIKGEMLVNIQSNAFGPLDAWVAKHNDAVQKQKLVNKAYDAMVTARAKASHQKEATDVLQGKVLAQDPKLLEAQRKLQQLQDAYTIATNKHGEEEEQQFQRLAALNTEAATVQTIIRHALGLAGAALLTARDAIPDAPAIAAANAPADAATHASAAAQAAAAAAAAAQAAQAAGQQQTVTVNKTV